MFLNFASPLAGSKAVSGGMWGRVPRSPDLSENLATPRLGPLCTSSIEAGGPNRGVGDGTQAGRADGFAGAALLERPQGQVSRRVMYQGVGLTQVVQMRPSSH